MEDEQQFLNHDAPRRAPAKDPPVRLDGNIERHILKYLPPTKKDKTPTRKCRVCIRKNIRKETRYYCSLCGIPMHNRSCYIRYHTLVDY